MLSYCFRVTSIGISLSAIGLRYYALSVLFLFLLHLLYNYLDLCYRNFRILSLLLFQGFQHKNLRIVKVEEL